jgi:hypothetical protein
MRRLVREWIGQWAVESRVEQRLYHVRSLLKIDYQPYHNGIYGATAERWGVAEIWKGFAG